MTPTAAPQSDSELLRRYLTAGDREAFAEIVRRHIGFVRAAARRQTRGDWHLADDVTQAVFIVLARRAETIRPGVPLTAWLFSVTRHAAGNVMKSRDRQALHVARLADETREQLVTDDSIERDEHHAAVRQHLDDSLAKLPSLERAGVLLHYFGGQTHAEVGAALGLSAEAARKRVTRALERMRDFLVGRGVAVTSAMALSTLLQHEASIAQAAAATGALAASTANVATIAASSSASASPSLAIADSVVRVFALAKLKVAAALMITCAGLVGITLHAGTKRSAVPAPTVATLTTTFLQPAPERNTFQTNVADKIKIDFLGVSTFPPNEGSWFTIAGQPCSPPEKMTDHTQRKDGAPFDHTIALKITMPKDANYRVRVEDVSTLTVSNDNEAQGEDIASYITASFANDAGPSAKKATLTIYLADQPWKTIHTHENAAEGAGFDIPGRGECDLSPVSDDAGRARVLMHYVADGEPYRLVAVTDDGKELEADDTNNSNSNGQGVSECWFGVPAEKVKKLLIQTRKFAHVVTVENVCLSPAEATEPKITVRKSE